MSKINLSKFIVGGKLDLTKIGDYVAKRNVAPALGEGPHATIVRDTCDKVVSQVCAIVPAGQKFNLPRTDITTMVMTVLEQTAFPTNLMGQARAMLNGAAEVSAVDATNYNAAHKDDDGFKARSARPADPGYIETKFNGGLKSQRGSDGIPLVGTKKAQK